jgi:hypothetical protein
MPALAGLNKKYDGESVRVMGVLLDSQNKDRARIIMEKTGADFACLLDDGTFARQLFAVPQTYFINSQGTVVYSIIGSVDQAQLDMIVDTLLK